MSSYGSIEQDTGVTVQLSSGSVHGKVQSDQGDEVFVLTDTGNLLRAHKKNVVVDYDEERFNRIMSAWRAQ